MMPVYRYMDSYPHQGNQVSAGPNYYPSFEAKVDPSKTVLMNQPWPYPNNFGHSIPCYPFTGDGNFPGCYSHGFYPHSPAPQVHFCGHYPPFPGAFPVQYVPPPCYLKELPRYDYDKPKDHCCGCPNHSHYQKYGGGERMEEEEPKSGSKFGNSKVPFQLENYPYPVLWIPPEYMKNEEHKKPLESDRVIRQMKPPQNVKPNEQDPKESHSWFPLDMKSLQPFLLGDDGKRTRDQQSEERMQEFPFPIIWMPPRQKQNEDEKEEEGNMNGPPIIAKYPVKVLDNGPGTRKAQDIHDNASGQVNSQVNEKSTNQRIIPVKQIEVFKEGENSEGAERRGRSTSPKKREDNETGKASGAGARRNSSSPPKSKLPPVCLRVDPLPRKKSSRMSSRSPSPPGSTGKSEERTKEALKLPVISDNKAQAYQDSAEEKKGKGAATEVVEKERAENKGKELKNDSEIGNHVCSSVDSSDQTTQQSEKNDVKSIIEGDKGLESADVSTIIKQANEKQETNDESRFVEGDKKNLSVDEAACHIQSAYRGYQVRRWEPLKKLKQIGEVQEEMDEIRKKIHGLESSVDLQNDEKQTVVIGEMIMRLLLKLDTIQGLDPNLRNVRKSLARELVMLQEKLDLLAKANNCNEKPSDSEEGKTRDEKEYPTDDIPHSVLNNQDEETSKPPMEAVNDEQLVARDIEFPSNGSQGEVDGELSSTMILEQDRAGTEETWQLCLDNEGDSKDYYAQVSELEEPQAVISEDLVNSPVEQMGTDILDVRKNNEIDSSSTKLDESDTEDQVVEVLNELPIGLIEDEEIPEHEQAGLLGNVLLHDGDVGEKEAIEWQSIKQTPLELEEARDLNEPLELEEARDLNEAKQEATLVEGGSYTSSPLAMEVHKEGMIDPEDMSCIPEGENVTVPNLEEEKTGEEGRDSLNQVAGGVNVNEGIEGTVNVSDMEQKIAMEGGKKLVEENEKMREMVEKLVACGREQLAAISKLTGRVNHLENKLRRKKVMARRCRPAISSPNKKPVRRAS